MFKTFKKWLLSDGTPHHTKLSKHISAEKAKQQELAAGMVGEPVTSFIASLEREPKRYKVEQVRSLCEFPQFPHYHRMDVRNGAWKFTDKKTGLTLGAYLHTQEEIYSVYGLPFNLNIWEKRALYVAFQNLRHEALERKGRMWRSSRQRERDLANKLEKEQRLSYAEMFK